MDKTFRESDFPATFLERCADAIDQASGQERIGVIYDKESGWVATVWIRDGRLQIYSLHPNAGEELAITLAVMVEHETRLAAGELPN